MATLSSDNYQLKWHSFGSHLHTSVATLFQSEQYTDTLLCTSDGHQLSAHRFLLSLCSVYFQNIFKLHAKTTSTLPLIVILPPEIDVKTLKTLIQYIYCGETTVSNDILENVLKAGDLLKIRGLWRPKEHEQQLLNEQSVHPEPIVKKTTKPIISMPSSNNSLTISEKHAPTIRKIVLSKDRSRISNLLNVPPLEPISTSNSGMVNDGIKIENVRTQLISDSSHHIDTPLRTYSNIKLELKKSEKLKALANDSHNSSSSSSTQKLTAEVDKITLPKVDSSEKSDEKKIIKVVLKNTPHQKSASASSEASKDDNNKQNTSANSDENSDKYLVIKEEPIEWDQLDDVELSENELFHTEMTIKPEIIFPNDEEEYQMHIDEEKDDNYYSPLTCELCSETFSVPADWVRHIESHSELYQPAKRQRRGRSNAEEENTKLPPLICDLCQKILPTPAEWVRHIQQTHTEKELAANNNSNSNSKPKIVHAIAGNLKVCGICNKRFPSHASMVIHARTHTGERPFLCTLCNKGFNVKSNLLRHLRTLHDKIINSTEVSGAEKTESTCSD